MSQSPSKDTTNSPQPTTTDTADAAKRGNRGLSWSVEEDEQLCRSWADTNVGGETTTLSMWDRIKGEFHTKITPRTERSASAMRSRWHVVQGQTMKFCEAVAEAETQFNPDAENGNLVLTEAFKIFRRNAKFNEGFNLQHCWTVLRDKHKWKTIVAKKQAREAKNAMMAGHATPMPTSYRLPQGQQHHLPQYTPQTQQPTQPIQTQVHHSADPPQLQTEPSTQPQVLTQPMQPQIQPIDQSANSCNIVLAPQKKRKPSTHDAEYNTSKLRLKERKLDIKIMAFDPMQFVDPIRREFFKIQQKEVLCRWRRIIQDDNQQGDEEVATS